MKICTIRECIAGVAMGVTWLVAGYPYRAHLLSKQDPAVLGPQLVTVVYDYHPKHPLDQEYRKILREQFAAAQKRCAENCCFIVEDLHSQNMFGASGHQRYALLARGGLLAGLADEIGATGTSVKNVEYRYTRVAGCAQMFANPELRPHSFAAAQKITIADIKAEAADAVHSLLHSPTDPCVRTKCHLVAQKGWEAFNNCINDTANCSLADCLSRYQGEARKAYLKQLLTVDKQLFEALLLAAVLSSDSYVHVIVAAGGTHCAALAQFLLQSGYQHCVMIQDLSALRTQKPQALSPGQLQYALYRTFSAVE